jgi:hypothetical protein
VERYLWTLTVFDYHQLAAGRTGELVEARSQVEAVLPEDVPGHPYAVAMETVRLAPNAQVSLYPWKASKDQIPLAVRHIRTLLRAHRPAAAATQPLAAAAQ